MFGQCSFLALFSFRHFCFGDYNTCEGCHHNWDSPCPRKSSGFNSWVFHGKVDFPVAWQLHPQQPLCLRSDADVDKLILLLLSPEGPLSQHSCPFPSTILRAGIQEDDGGFFCFREFHWEDTRAEQKRRVFIKQNERRGEEGVLSFQPFETSKILRPRRRLRARNTPRLSPALKKVLE